MKFPFFVRYFNSLNLGGRGTCFGPFGHDLYVFRRSLNHGLH